MSGRSRRPEPYWADKEEKRASNISPGRSQNWSKSEAHDDLMHGNYSRSPSRDGPKYDDISRDRNRMYSDPTHDGWDKQYSTHPSDDSYGPPYRSWDRSNTRVTHERDRTRSPNRSRSRSRSRDRMSRSSRESTRNPRHETNASYPNMRNDHKNFDSRGGGNNNNINESWNRRTDYKGGSRYDDDRNVRKPCRYFAAGNCSRDDCRFSHDVPEAPHGYDNNRNSGNKNRTWHNDQGPRSPRGSYDDRNAESNHGEMEKKKKWNSSVWDDVEPGGFNGTSENNNNNNDNNNTWESSEDKKTKKWDGRTWDEFSERVPVKTDDNKVRKWDGQGLTENAVNESDLNNVVSEDANRQSHMLSLNSFNGPLNEPGYVHMENQNKEASLTSQPAPQPTVVPEAFHKGQISQMCNESNLTNAIDYLKSLPNSAYNQDDVTRAKEEENLEVKKEAVEASDKRVVDNNKKEEENNNTNPDNVDTHGKTDEGDSGNDEKAMKQFKVGLVEFVKDILKPKWKEGKMSRDAHKTVVKKVVEKVTSTIQGSQIPKTQPKIDQYLAYSKPKITKLVEAYMERLVKS